MDSTLNTQSTVDFLAIATEHWNQAKADYAAAKTYADRREADAMISFWASKMAYFSLTSLEVTR